MNNSGIALIICPKHLKFFPFDKSLVYILYI